MLNNKQKAYLKALGNKERAIYQIGKDEISDNLIEGINNYLDAHELIKVNILKSATISANEAAIVIASRTAADIVQIIGRTIILYRPSKKGLIDLP